MGNEEIVESLASLMHDIWKRWSRTIAREEMISRKRYTRWKQLWEIEYKDLPREMKEKDRKLAREILSVLAKHRVQPPLLDSNLWPGLKTTFTFQEKPV